MRYRASQLDMAERDAGYRRDRESKSSLVSSTWPADRHGASNAWCQTSTNQVCFAPIRRDSDAGCYGRKHEM
jgi:hypothetical protein